MHFENFKGKGCPTGHGTTKIGLSFDGSKYTIHPHHINKILDFEIAIFIRNGPFIDDTALDCDAYVACHYQGVDWGRLMKESATPLAVW